MASLETDNLADEDLRKVTKPTPDKEALLCIVKHFFCKDPTNDSVEIIKQLDSYDDCNFLVQINGQHYLLKVHNGAESADYIRSNRTRSSKIDLSNAMYRHLLSNGIMTNGIVAVVRDSSEPLQIPPEYGNCPATFKVKEGDDVALGSLAVFSPKYSPRILAVQLLTWIEGRTMSDAPSLPIETIADSGVFLGRLCQVLDTMPQPLPEAAMRYHAWDGRHSTDLRKYSPCITDEKRRSMVENIIDAFEKEVLPDASKFRVGLIQGDFNDANIMLNATELKVSGVIDFGDSVQRYVIIG